MLTVAIDPGKWKCGVAIGDGRLSWAATLHVGDRDRDHPGLLPVLVAREIRERVCPTPLWRVHLVQEDPQDYPGHPRRRRDLAQLREHNRSTRALLERCLTLPYSGVLTSRLVRPGRWKGNVPKDVHHRRVVQELSLAERDLCTELNHDGWDAVGLWLWAVGRVRRGGLPLKRGG